jgi:predicted transcriptional regulator
MAKPMLGELELETLRFISDNAPLSVGEVASQFGEPRGLARTTILTIMERLRAKGYLRRLKDGSLYRYSPETPKADVMKDLVRDFVENRLAGSLTPFTAYLAEADGLSASEIAALRRIVEGLDDRKGGASDA